MVTITLNGETKEYSKDIAKKYFEKLYNELEEKNSLFTTKAQKVCYVLAWLRTDATEINADKYYY